MANQPQDREDLLREATALVERAEFSVAGSNEPAVVGFRRDGSASIFLGVDPVFQFNRRDELRRAYRQGYLFKAECGRLVRLQRNPTATAIEMVRHMLSDDEQTAFLDDLVHRMTELRLEIGASNWTLIGKIPETVDVMTRIQTWLDQLALPPAIAAAPRLS